MSSIEYHVSDVGSLSVEAFQWICTTLPQSSHILELGSGEATRELVKAGYHLISVEHDSAWLGKFDSHYIHAPLKGGWYDASKLVALKDLDYNLILIDGPPACTRATKNRRRTFLRHLALFDTRKSILIDDCQRSGELQLLKDLQERLQRSYELHPCEDGKVFGVIR